MGARGKRGTQSSAADSIAFGLSALAVTVALVFFLWSLSNSTPFAHSGQAAAYLQGQDLLVQPKATRNNDLIGGGTQTTTGDIDFDPFAPRGTGTAYTPPTGSGIPAGTTTGTPSGSTSTTTTGNYYEPGGPAAPGGSRPRTRPPPPPPPP